MKYAIKVTPLYEEPRTPWIWHDSMGFGPGDVCIITWTADFVFTILYWPIYEFFPSPVWSLGCLADLAGNYHPGFPEGLSQLQTGRSARQPDPWEGAAARKIPFTILFARWQKWHDLKCKQISRAGSRFYHSVTWAEAESGYWACEIFSFPEMKCNCELLTSPMRNCWQKYWY